MKPIDFYTAFKETLIEAMLIEKSLQDTVYVLMMGSKDIPDTQEIFCVAQSSVDGFLVEFKGDIDNNFLMVSVNANNNLIPNMDTDFDDDEFSKSVDEVYKDEFLNYMDKIKFGQINPIKVVMNSDRDEN